MKSLKKFATVILCVLFSLSVFSAAFASNGIENIKLESGYKLSFTAVEGINEYHLGAYITDMPSSNGGYHYEQVTITPSNGYTANGSTVSVYPEAVKEAISKEIEYFSASGNVPITIFVYYYDETVGSLDSDEIDITVNTETLEYVNGTSGADYTAVNPDPEIEEQGFFARILAAIKAFFTSVADFFRSLFSRTVV